MRPSLTACCLVAATLITAMPSLGQPVPPAECLARACAIGFSGSLPWVQVVRTETGEVLAQSTLPAFPVDLSSVVRGDDRAASHARRYETYGTIGVVASAVAGVLVASSLLVSDTDMAGPLLYGGGVTFGIALVSGRRAGVEADRALDAYNARYAEPGD